MLHNRRTAVKSTTTVDVYQWVRRIEQADDRVAVSLLLNRINELSGRVSEVIGSTIRTDILKVWPRQLNLICMWVCHFVRGTCD
jgi:hypothetical protein